MIGKSVVFQLSLKQGGEIFFHFRKVEMTVIPCAVSSFQRSLITGPVIADSFRNNSSAWQKGPRAGAEEIIADCASRAPVPFDERVNPIQPPKTISRQFSR